jgi:diguanylate cyclase (GGDEF)-like protein
VATLRQEERTAGLLLVADPLSDVQRFEPGDIDLLGALAAQVSVFLEYDRLGQALDQLSSLQGRLVHQAYHDHLTGLANRALFVERMAQAHRAHAPMAVMFIDLDDFKVVNDELGHDAGDDVLVAFARRLEGSLRAGDLAARLGGDEFAVLVEQPGRREDELAVAERVLAALGTPFAVGNRRFTVRASIGLASGDPTSYTVDELMANADLAMYAAKHSGKNRVTAFEQPMRAGVQQRLELEAALGSALAEDELATVFQPVVELATGRPVGLEALARWTDRAGDAVSPEVFIPLAEGCGLIEAIGRRSLRAACEAYRQLAGAGVRDLYVSVNVAARELQHHGFVDQVRATLADHGVHARRLVLEVTEGTLLARGDEGLARLEALRADGVRVAVDDFGTGYSSLGALRSLPVDIIKVDRQFVRGLLRSPEERAVAAAIVALASAVGASVVAENVETAEEAESLRAIGCTLGQGNYYCEPLGAGQLDRLVRGIATVASAP